MSDTVAVVPARGGSKGVPRKNLRTIDGQPLVSYQIETALAAERIDRVILSTDDEEIAEIGQKYGAEVPFIRPASLSQDDVPVIAVVKHALEYLIEENSRPTQIHCLQPTSPFTTPEQVDKAAVKLRNTDCDSVVAVERITDTHPHRAYRLEGDRIAPLEGITDETPNQRQDRPDTFGFTGAIYARKPKLLLNWDKTDFALGTDIRAIIQREESTIEIDTEFQLRIAKAIAKFTDEVK
ncbi:acylneuraminate cytidylyltransferase family protein [Halosimplex halophilum]|uniref:acylneuraminate cytidylyltransferase family protein n=1 Tax=Halosimplex halophilum TaxID=2559572 RepID=UPI00143550C9|nr:acylneuraminate cytidylyltransferase family protein [Halosimplex halophilum]